MNRIGTASFVLHFLAGFAGVFSEEARADWFAIGSSQPAPVSIQVISTTPQSTLIRFSIQGIEISPVQVQGRAYSQLSIPDAGLTSEVGMPELPRVGRNFIIPVSSRPELRVVSTQTKQLRIPPLLPSKGALTRNVNPMDVPFTFSSVFYGGAGPTFPLTQFVLSKAFFLRKVRGVNVTFFPVQTDPASGLVTLVTEAIVELRTPNPARALRMTAGTDALDDGFLQIYRSRFANFSLLENSRVQHFIKDTGRMLVISHPTFAEAVKPLVEWKTRRGMQVSLVTTDVAGKTAENIFKYIADKYKNEQISYVLLVGDAEFVPYHVGKSGNADGSEADPMYALVEGDDSYPDLVVSRFSVKDTTELQTMVAKTIGYERDPDMTGDWYSKATGIASNEGSPTDAARAEILRAALEGYGYTQVDKFYDPQAKKADLIDALNEGRGFVNYIGHGSKTSWVTTDFENSDVDALRNNGKLPFIVSVACVNGEFGYGSDSFAERWMKAGDKINPRGAVAIFASSTNQAWVPPTVGQKEITNLLVAEKFTTVGALFFHGSIAVLEDADSEAEQTFETWHIFGDGSLQVRTKRPALISALLPQEVQEGTDQLLIETGESGIQAGVVQNGALIGAGISEKDGRLVIKFEKPVSKDRAPLQLTLTGFNKLPLMGEASVR